MQQFFIAIILVLGLSTWWLYGQNQTFKANQIKLEAAVEEQKQAMEIMKEQYEKQGKALMNMSRQNAQIEQEKAQYLAIKMLVGEKGKICVVGDEDQSIYAFRGADIKYIQKFEEDFPNALVINLEENYRSCEKILTGATNLIGKNT